MPLHSSEIGRVGHAGFAAANDVPQPAEPSHRTLLNAIPHLVWQSWDGGDWFESSPQWDAFTGQSEVATKGDGWQKVIHADDLAATVEAWQLATKRGSLAVDHRIRRHDGEYRWFQTRALPVSNPTGEAAEAGRRWIGTSTDVDDLRRAEERIRTLAFQDVLTGAGNRLLLIEVLERMIGEAGAGRRAADGQAVRPLSVLSLDIDEFQLVNQLLGPRGGDEVLGEVARRLRGSVRDTDVVTRGGGDEFVLVQPGGTAKGAARLADRIRGRIAEPLVIGGQGLTISVSIGIATCPRDGQTPEELLRRADVALSRAKADGRNRAIPFELAMEIDRRQRQALVQDLAQAIERDTLQLAYQPVFDVRTGERHGVEALARWTRGGHGPVSPVSFIPLAEECGLIVPLGTRVLERACREASRGAFDNLCVSVNVSAAQLRDGTLPAVVTRALEGARLPPDRLELEVTERTLLERDETLDRTLRSLKAIGVRIALDDFGTGYSNLGYLCRFPFDRLKIDQSFVERLETDKGSRAVVSGIISLAHTLGLLVTAEGVETEGQLLALRRLGCDQVQGFLLGRPEPAPSRSNPSSFRSVKLSKPC